MVSALCVCFKKYSRNLKLKFQITVRRLSCYFSSFARRESGMVPITGDVGRALAPLEGTMGLVLSLNSGYSACQLLC